MTVSTRLGASVEQRQQSLLISNSVSLHNNLAQHEEAPYYVNASAAVWASNGRPKTAQSTRDERLYTTAGALQVSSKRQRSQSASNYIEKKVNKYSTLEPPWEVGNMPQQHSKQALESSLHYYSVPNENPQSDSAFEERKYDRLAEKQVQNGVMVKHRYDHLSVPSSPDSEVSLLKHPRLVRMCHHYLWTLFCSIKNYLESSLGIRRLYFY